MVRAGEFSRRSTRPPRPAPPPAGARSRDALLGFASGAGAAGVGLVVAAAIVAAAVVAWPSLRAEPLGVLIGDAWDPPRGRFGAAPAVVGTLLTSAVALLVAAPIALGAATFLAEVAPRQACRSLDVALDVAAAVPSVVWGLFALDAVLPRVAGVWGASSGGHGLLTGGVVLGAMIVPTIACVAREVLRAVPREQREAAVALGATRWEVVRRVVLPVARGGLFGALLLGLGRALGEATVMAMVVGSRHAFPTGVGSPGTTAAALLLEQVGEASSAPHVAALAHVALLLSCVSLAVHLAARLLLSRALSSSSARSGA